MLKLQMEASDLLSTESFVSVMELLKCFVSVVSIVASASVEL